MVNDVKDNDEVDVEEEKDEAEKEDTKLKLVNIYLPVEILNWYDVLVKERIVANRSQAFRMAITDYLIKLVELRKLMTRGS